MPKKLSELDIIKRINTVYKDKNYKYILPTKYNVRTNIEIICPIHGKFYKTLNTILNSNSFLCPYCTGHKFNTEVFIELARKKWGDTYNYSKVEYKDYNSSIIIRCHEHGEFITSPHLHLNKNRNIGGCQKCSLIERSYKLKVTWKEFIERSLIIHSNKYSYPIDFILNSIYDKVPINCPIHGVFIQEAHVHLSGCGCQKCKKEKNIKNRTLTTDYFINSSRIIHGNEYDYSKVIYKRKKDKVIIICPEHGEFLQTPDKHLQGQGCPNCIISKGEKYIKQYLQNKDIAFEQHKTFDTCKNISLLNFDFYLPIKNILIEFDGPQHREYTPYFHKSINDFIDQQKRDTIKNNWSIKNKYKLIRIFMRNNFVSYEQISKILDIKLGVQF